MMRSPPRFPRPDPAQRNLRNPPLPGIISQHLVVMQVFAVVPSNPCHQGSCKCIL